MNLPALQPERAWQMVLDQLRQDAENAAQFANQGITDMGRSQVLILLLVVLLMIVILLGLTSYLIIRRLIRIQRTFRQHTTSRWASETKAHRRKSEELDVYQQMLIEQQWLLNQLLLQGHEDADIDVPTDGWS